MSKLASEGLLSSKNSRFCAMVAVFSALLLLFTACSGGGSENATMFKIKATCTDDDGKSYRVVAIGNKTWMAENLNYKAGNSWCYENDENNCQKNGRLYGKRPANPS